MSIEIDTQMSNLYEQVVQLYAEGRYQQGLAAANVLCELARQNLPADDPQLAACLNNAALLHRALGHQHAAHTLYEQALTIYRQHMDEYRTDYATTANNLAGIHWLLRNYALAEALYQEAIQIWRAQNLENSAELAGGLNNLAALYEALGRYPEAKALLQQALAMTQQVYGNLHVDVAHQYHNLAVLHQAMGAYAEAEALYQQAFAVMRQLGRTTHPDMATFLNNSASLARMLGKYAQAEADYQQALQILLATVGEQHFDAAMTLTGLAGLALNKADYSQAESLYRRAQVIIGTTMGEADPAYATSLSNLALLYDVKGEYVEAERLYQQALTMKQKTLGEQHPAYAATLHLLAALYSDWGRYGQAETYYQQALQIRRTTLGQRHPQVADSLNGLAELYREIGSFAKAEPLYQAALDIRRTAFGENHPLVAQSLNNLGLLAYAQGAYAPAASYFRQALERRRAIFGETHPDVAQSLHNLAVILRLTGDYTTAAQFIQAALTTYQAAHLEQHPYFAAFLSHLAQIYEWQGRYADAQSLHQQAVAAYRTSLGDHHPYVASALSNLAVVYAATGQQTQALPLLEAVMALDDRFIGQIFALGSEQQRAAYLATIQGHVDTSLSFLLMYRHQLAQAAPIAFTMALRRKAIGAEALATQRDTILGGRYPALAPQLQALTTLRRQIAQKMLAGPGLETLTIYREQLAEWTVQRENQEAALARQIPELNLTQALQTIDLPAVANALPAGSVLVEFMRFTVFNFSALAFSALAEQTEQRWQPARYLAFVLPAGEPDNVQMIDLGEAEPIDQLITAYRVTLTGEEERPEQSEGTLERFATAPISVRSDPALLRTTIDLGMRHLRQPSSAPQAGKQLEVGAALRQAIFEPLLPALAGRTQLFLAPDGDLSRLPFEVLPLDQEHYLIDAYQISYLSAGRDLLRFGDTTSGPPAPPLVVADPDFDLTLGPPAGLTPGRPFGRLAGTYHEGKAVGQRLGIEPLLGKLTLVSEIKACCSPWVLHIATHGFFLPDTSANPKLEARLPISDAFPNQRLDQLSQLPNPLLRSGLALAGANTWLQTGPLPSAAENGLLTAEDVTGLDLQSTALVVLSACETGLGDVRVGEGVFGLRRAFVLAGAKTLVMSLWKVPDQQTQALMVDFYQHILAGKPRAVALREAQLVLKKAYPDPRFWGAFICQGDPRPLK